MINFLRVMRYLFASLIIMSVFGYASAKPTLLAKAPKFGVMPVQAMPSAASDHQLQISLPQLGFSLPISELATLNEGDTIIGNNQTANFFDFGVLNNSNLPISRAADDDGEAIGSSVVMASPSAISAEADSFLRSGNSNTNEGTNLNMVVRSSGKNRAMVSFDMSALSAAAGTLDSVSLNLYVVHNGDNWGNTGRTIDAHRLLESWAEGDGANLKPGNLSQAEFGPFDNRGDGLGTTWKCATDTEINNQQSDCDPKWNGGTFDPVSTDTVTIYKEFGGNNSLPPTTKTMGWITFDVTDDVNDCLSEGVVLCSWLIKKTQEGQNGRIEFATKDGASALYNAQFGESVEPRLDITYQQPDPIVLLFDEFEGTALNTTLWDFSSHSHVGASAIVNNGILTINSGTVSGAGGAVESQQNFIVGVDTLVFETRSKVSFADGGFWGFRTGPCQHAVGFNVNPNFTGRGGVEIIGLSVAVSTPERMQIVDLSSHIDATEWHTYRIEHTGDEARFYVDDVLEATLTEGFVLDCPMTIRLDRVSWGQNQTLMADFASLKALP